MVDHGARLSEIDVYRSNALASLAERRQHDMMLAEAIAVAKTIVEIDALLSGKKGRRSYTRRLPSAGSDQLAFDFDTPSYSSQKNLAETDVREADVVVVEEEKQRVPRPEVQGHDGHCATTVSSGHAGTPGVAIHFAWKRFLRTPNSPKDFRFAISGQNEYAKTRLDSSTHSERIGLGRKWLGSSAVGLPLKSENHGWPGRGALPEFRLRQASCRISTVSATRARDYRRRVETDGARAPPMLSI